MVEETEWSRREAEEEWPRITIVTPSFNQAPFLEETTRSVLLQGYPNLEYVVMDGGSTDGSVDILKRYSDWIDRWVSEKDGGQADALNKGFSVATGEIFGYLNSDDLYEPGTLHRVARDFVAGGGDCWHTYPVEDFWPDGRRELVPVPRAHGRSERLRADRAAASVLLEGGHLKAASLLAWLLGCLTAHQPGTFWSSNLFKRVGGFDSSMHYGFDQKFFWELIARGYAPLAHEGLPVARFRWHETSKSQNAEDASAENRFAEELYAGALDFRPRLSRRERRVLESHYVNYKVSLVWRRMAAGGGTGESLRALASIARKVPSSVTSRFWAGTLRRVLAGGPSGP